MINQRSEEQGYVAAPAAAELLGVKLQTLYAYASRGLVASLPGMAGRARRYRTADLLQLKARASAWSTQGLVAAAAPQRGEPVMESALTLVTAGGPFYRGASAVQFATDGVSFERVADWIWESTPDAKPPTAEAPPAPAAPRASAKKSFAGAAAGRADVASRAISALIQGRAAVVETPAASVTPSWPPPDFGADARALASLIRADAHPLSKMALTVPAIGGGDESGAGAPRSAELVRARRLVRRLAASVALPDVTLLERSLAEPTVAGALAAAFGQPATAGVCRLLDRALVLCVDHELSSATFAARLAASTGVDLYSCISAALATLSGPSHGGTCDRVEALVDEIGSADRAETVLRARLRRGELVPGFVAQAEAGADPRCAALLEGVRLAGSNEPKAAALLALVDAMEREGRAPPTLETGLVALSLALRLPPGSATALFVIGRSAGWIAHVLEQRQSPAPLQPRARYSGAPPR